MTIGPTHSYPHGKPLMPGDRGGINIGFQAISELGVAIMDFRTDIEFLCDRPDALCAFAARIRATIIIAFGRRSYDASTLPLKVSANPQTGMVEIDLPMATPMIVANPEMWLALAERIEEEAAKLR